MRRQLRRIAILHGRIPASLAPSTGFHAADDVVKYLMAGADVVMTTSSLPDQGVGHMCISLQSTVRANGSTDAGCRIRRN